MYTLSVMLGYCQCIGPNWTGPLCDRCAPGYVGSDCHPANRTTTTTTTTTTTSSTTTATHVFISSTRMSTTGTSKSATTGSPNMITDREPGSINTTKQTSNYQSTPSASVHTTTYSVQNVSGMILHTVTAGISLQSVSCWHKC